MLLKELPEDYRVSKVLNFKYNNISYSCTTTFLPFGIKNYEKYKNEEIKDVLTPIYQLEFRNEDNNIYKNQWIMNGQILWWLENENKDKGLRYLVNYAAEENDFLKRIKEADKKIELGTQMSLF